MGRELTKAILEIIELLKEERLFDINLSLIKKALDEKKENINDLIEIGIKCAQFKKIDQSLFIFNGLLNFIKTDIRIYYNLGIIYSMNKEHCSALEAYDCALKIQPDDVETLINKGCTLNDMANHQLAFETIKSAVQINPSFPEAWSNMGIALNNLGLHKDSVDAYLKAINLNENYFEAWSNKSIPLRELGLYQESLDACEKALILKPDYAEGWSNKGNTLFELKRYEEALMHYDRALSLKPDYAEGWSNKGNALFELKRYEEALMHYDRAIELKKEIDWMLGNYLLVKAQIGDWLNFDQLNKELIQRIKRGEKVATPFASLGLINDEEIHYKAACIFSSEKFPSQQILGPIRKNIRDKKIRVGYFSGDLGEHAVAYLTAELFEIHDRSKFEIIGFAWRINSKDLMTQRISAAFDRFIDVDGMSSLQIAKLSRELKIDIAIDLMGYTQYSKTDIFSYRAAPIQCGYIGYLGSMGSDYFDYIIGDKTVIPNEHRKYFTEKIVYLPSYQVNDSKRQISSKINNRENFGISKDAFVFCCFNSNYKIQPQAFQIWMEVLKSVENSILWLIESSEAFKKNLLREAGIVGIGQGKILFAPPTNRQEYLERYQVVDLFLDTLPYNAGTTASDALWCGVPVITHLGNSYSGKMAASLLKTLDLHELIVNSSEQYKNVSIDLANQPERLQKIKSKLIDRKQKSRLFDSKFFCRNLELAYIKMYEMHQLDKQFEDIEICQKI